MLVVFIRTCTAQCNDAQFECGAPHERCIPLRWFCDGEVDCEGEDDEPAEHEKCSTYTRWLVPAKSATCTAKMKTNDRSLCVDNS